MKLTSYFKILSLLTMAVSIMGFTTSPSNTIKIGTIAGPETSLVEVAKEIAKKKYNLNIEIIQFTDYLQPNAALEDGSIDMNMFQHLPFLEQQIKTRGYHLVAIGKTFIFPMAIYSTKHKNISSIEDGATISIPNDPTNEGRALLLLQQARLINIKQGVGYLATPGDISANPHKLKFVELNGPQLPRSLADVDYSVINNTFAFTAGLNPKTDAVRVETSDSPYANLIVVKAGQENNRDFLKFVNIMQSKAVNEKAKTLFNNTAIVAR